MVFDQFANFIRPELSKHKKDQLVLFPVSVFVNVCAYTHVHVFQGMLCGQTLSNSFNTCKQGFGDDLSGRRSSTRWRF